MGKLLPEDDTAEYAVTSGLLPRHHPAIRGEHQRKRPDWALGIQPHTSQVVKQTRADADEDTQMVAVKSENAG